jgi:hypothetical protein
MSTAAWAGGDVSNDRFADRLDAKRFADDPIVEMHEHGPADADALCISERLFARLAAVATGYELHTLPMLGGADPVTLNRTRCASLLAEVVFVAERLNDPLIHEVAQAVQDYITRRTNNPLWDGGITVEGE